MKIKMLLLVFLNFILLSNNRGLAQSNSAGSLQESPNPSFSISLTASGPYREPANIELVAHVSDPEKVDTVAFYTVEDPASAVLQSNFLPQTSQGGILLETKSAAPYTCNVSECSGSLAAGHYEFKAIATSKEHKIFVATLSVDVLASNQYGRALNGMNPYFSLIEALDFEDGVFLDKSFNNYELNKTDANNNFEKRYPQGYPWFLRTAANPNIPKEPCYHLFSMNIVGARTQSSYRQVNEIPLLNGVATGDAPPMVAFGREGGGKELLVGQSYRFGINAGGQRPNFFNNADLKIEVYDKEDFAGGAINVAPILTKTYSLPRDQDPNGWGIFNNESFIKDFHILEPCNGKMVDFDTQVQYVPYVWTWNDFSKYPLLIVHQAGNDSFYYKVSVMGVASVEGELLDMAKNAAKTEPAYNVSYSLDFNATAPWSAVLLNQPHFRGIPLPSCYQGKSVDELLLQTKPVSDTLPAPEAMTYNLTAVNNSPELKSHPELDRIVSEYGNDPMALANYVLNEIELTDAVGYNVTGKIDDISINPQGVSRDALGTYLEGQGSPAEQCGLLIYLLRKAGYPAAYVFPEHNKMLLFDEQLSKLLQIQVRGIKDDFGMTAEKVPELIPVNYPWVATYIDGKWIHLFPWLKDTSVIEGKDVWNYFPPGYQNGTQWLTRYLLNDPAIRSLSKKDNLGTLFTIYTQNQLAAAGLTLEDVGMHIFNHRHYYKSWDEFPKPWQTPTISQDNLAQNLDVNQNSPAVAPALKDIFDTIEITVFSDRGNKSQLHPGSKILRDPAPGDPTISTGVLRMVDLHNRRFLLRHQPLPNGTFKVILSLEPYDSTPSSTDTETYSFNAGDHRDPGNLRSHQEATTILQTTKDGNNDNFLCYDIKQLRHQQAQAITDRLQRLEAGDKSANTSDAIYPNQFPGVGESTVIEDCRSLLKGDMAVLNLNYGRVTLKMQEFEARKYWDYQQHVAANPSAPINPEIATGQLLQIMGQSYYYKGTQFRGFINSLLKVRSISLVAHGLTKLSAERNPDGTPTIITVNGHPDLKLAYPNVDMSFSHAAYVGNLTMHPDSGDPQLHYLDAMQLEIGDGSANEHRIINEFFGQNAAISTVKLLDLAQGWTPETGVASHPGSGIVYLTKDNYINEGNKTYTGTAFGITESKPLSEWGRSFWGSIKETLTDPDTGAFSSVLMTPTPITAPGQPGKTFTGMGAMVIGVGKYGAYISSNMIVTLGGSGEEITYNVPQNDPPPVWVNNGSLNLTDDGAVYNNVEMNVVNNDVNYYNDSGVSNNFDTVNDQLSEGKMQLDPQAQSSLDSYQQAANGTLNIDVTQVDDSGGSIANDPNASTVSTAPTQLVASSGSDVATMKEDQENRGYLGDTSFYSNISTGLSTFVYDPVSVITGEFYIDALDLKFNGPMPLEMRRSYSSKNQANSNFGYGWKLSYFPYLMLSSDSDTSPSFIYAAEMDGSVISYRRQNLTNSGEVIWVPKAVDNPNLVNTSEGTPGFNKNLFNNRITQKTVDGVIIYTLAGSDGSTRTFRTRSFPIVGSASLTRTRPYLETWQDSQGNCYSFTFGSDNKTPEWGQLVAITSNNGSSLHFHYDTKGHIIEAFTNDGRILRYEYSAQGDLTKVTLPDASVITYDYQKQPNPSGKGTYSTHLIVEEKKPGGRIIRNVYDGQRRVISQAATVGTSPTPTTSATFKYTVTSVNDDKTLNGTTEVTDVNGNTTTYAYTNSQITNITYPRNGSGVAPTVTQEWNSNSDYPRSLKKRIDQRGLITECHYDAAGNLISRSITGNLSGNGGPETATTTFTYNAQNLVTKITDPVGNFTIYAYSDAAHPYSPTSIIKNANGQSISTTQLAYQNLGLLSSVTRDGAITSYTYDSHGFLSSKTEQTGTTDPALTTKYTTNFRGEIVSQTDATGATSKYSYDPMGRCTGRQTYDTSGNIVDWHFNYYNGNGDITWEQGARFNPVDYVYYDYDRAGHVIHKGTWSSQATPDGKGVTSSSMAATTYTYDNQGNCTSITDSNGHVTTMTYDALSEMITRTSGDGAAPESFTYEIGGKIEHHTTALRGNEYFSYTSGGLLQTAQYADGTLTAYRYDLAGRCTQEIFVGRGWRGATYNGNTITYVVCEDVDKVIGNTSETYDGRGNLIEKTDLGGNKWSYTYDGLKRLKTEQGPLTQKTYLYKPGCTSWVNAKGEWKNTFVDALGRPVLETLFNRDGSIASNISNWYAPDHQSVVTTVGTGSNAITSTLYTDLQDRPLILQHADGSFQVNSYDAAGNKTAFQDEMGNITTYTYDALNHPTSEKLPDGTTIGYSYNAAGELLTRSMPGGLTEQNSYNEAGQKIADALVGNDGVTTGSHTYSYTLGRVSSISDPRGFTTSISYNGWNKPVSVISSGSTVPEQNQSTTYTYDPRGFLTSIAQNYANSHTGASTLVLRDYDAEGHLVSETTSLNGKEISSWSQTWDEVGRRARLNWGIDAHEKGAQYAFNYNALGLLTSSKNSSGTCSYAYGDQGLLLQKQTPAGTTSLTRNNRGNILSQKLPDGSTERLTYRADGKIGSYAISGSTQNETRNYAYDTRSRLIEEPYTLTTSTATNLLPVGTQTATYSFDPLNVRTSQEVTPTLGSAVLEKNSFSQVTSEHLLSGLLREETWKNSYDEAGEMVAHSSSPKTAQSLTWDSFGRLVNVASGKNNWSATYDGLGRRIQTISGNNVINYYYDPEVAFLELGHAIVHENKGWIYDSFTYDYTWNLYGPDRSGLYGGAQGIGGLEAEYDQQGGGTHGIINNAFGDVLGLVGSGSFIPYNSVLGGYGVMPGSEKIPTPLQPQWRSRYADTTGFYYMGARYYEPKSGRFISADPLGHAASMSLYDYCDGDPVNGLDPDGRCVEGTAKGYAFGTFGEYNNIPQAIGGVVGTGLSYVTPGLGEVAIARDIAGSAWHGMEAMSDIWDNGMNWDNGLKLGFASLGVVGGGFAAAELGGVGSSLKVGGVVEGGESGAVGVKVVSDTSPYGRVKLSKGTRAEIWERAKTPGGKVYDPSGVEIKPGEPWQAGHVPGHKFSDVQRRAAEEGWELEMWKAYQRDPDIYRPEKARTNLGHQYESNW